MEGEGAAQPLVEEGVGQVAEVPRLEEEGVPLMKGVVVAASLHVREAVVEAHHGMEVVVVEPFLTLLEVVVGLHVRVVVVVGVLLIVLWTELVVVVLEK